MVQRGKTIDEVDVAMYFWTLELTFRRFMEEFRVSAWRAPQVPRRSSGRSIDSRGARRDVAAEVHATCGVSEAKKEPGI